MKHEKTTLLDLTQFVASTCKETTRSSGDSGLSIIYSKNGKRVMLSRAILDTLSHPDTVQIVIDG